ncbi:hypothetical protein GCM10011375_41010 [Hymenobacter qilianensis]|uniref:Uncharacterized protein n=2 Tax=Hymenobacter qilianensis TaxID=1385715 RepID=A0ACB5PXI3_9BACT|nr:hypothetical protein [Hymenobacter qilianensis]QNP54545.1 hypothetical protein H9L05_22620 [Hymenobacter qilianensis]GGF81868.1 hypothetical protein GCM10011375_41010 [Hymenobacter qilianensis]
MVKAFFTLMLVAPLTGWAQAHLPPRTAVLPPPVRVEQALTGTVNPRLLQVPLGTFLYQHLRDTLSNHYVRPLPAGNWQLTIVRSISPRWVAVRWLPHSAAFVAGDTTLFYLPAQKGLQTIIQL